LYSLEPACSGDWLRFSPAFLIPVRIRSLDRLSRFSALKMDGAKLVTDTSDIRNDCGRQVFRLSRSFFERIDGSSGNKNPGGSKISLQ
jgi:hypothetical protein